MRSTTPWRVAALAGCAALTLVSVGVLAQMRTPSPATTTGPDPTAAPLPACVQPAGRVLRVGTGEPYALPSAAAAAAQAGDTVLIAAGDYRGDVAVWRAGELTICGESAAVRLHADGRSAEGKAIWVIKGSPVRIDGVAFLGARVPDRNGAGIRQEGERLLLHRCRFEGNENGLLSSNDPAAEIEIAHSRFAGNGHGDGYSHNLYVGRIARLAVRSSELVDANVGHQLKSRAAVNVIEASRISDAAGGNGSYLLDFPNGGAVRLIGNRLDKGPTAQNGAAISYGTEGRLHAERRLDLEGNAITVDHSSGAALQVVREAQQLRLRGNTIELKGRAVLLRGGFDPQAIER